MSLLQRINSWTRRLRPARRLKAEGMFAVERARLANGLRVWVKPRRGTGTVFLAVQVPVGSRHESKDDNGISHFVEHLLFTGTERWDEAAVTEVVRRRGGEANARTGLEDTVYWLNLRAADLDFGLTWMEQVIFRPTLAVDKVEKERQIIIEEKGGDYGHFDTLIDWIEDRGWGWSVFRAVRHRLFPESSLLLPVIGDDKSLKRLGHADLVAFYQRHYAPNNLTLVVVGDVDAAEVLRLAQARLGQFAPRDLPARPATLPEPPGSFQLRLRGPNINEQGQILLGAPLPGLGHPDRWPMLVLAEILHTLLTHDIRFKRGLVYGIDVYSTLYTDVGYFVIYTSAEAGKFDAILAEIERQLDRAARGDWPAAAVDEAKTALRGRFLLGMESNADVGWWLTEMALSTPEGGPVPDPFAGVEAVTPEDVARVARTRLAPDRRYQAIHRPAVTPGSLRGPLIVGLAALTGLGLWQFRRRRRKR